MKISIAHLIIAAAAAGTAATAALLPVYAPSADPAGKEPPSLSSEAPDSLPFYREGDWYRYALAPSYSLPGVKGDRGIGETTFESDSRIKFNAGYGDSFFTRSRYRLYDGDRAASNVIKDEIFASNDMRLLVQGHAGKRLNVFIDHDSKRVNQDENVYRMQYRAVNDDEVIREINAGDIDLKIDGSKYAFYDSGGTKSLGIDSTVRKGNLSVQGFMSVSKGAAETEKFKGNSTSASSSVAEYQYLRNTCFQLEPYRRYDGISDAAAVVFPAAYTSCIAFTSAPSDPSGYSPFPVNIAPASVEIWYDPQTTVANVNAVSFAPDGGAYVKLAEGTDFKVNYVTGEITFIRTVSSQSRIIAAYRLADGASSDPSALGGLIAGKISVYIKFGTSIDEDPDRDGLSNGDTNLDGTVNRDVYEIRSRYILGDRNLRADNFSFSLYNGTKLALATDRTKLGRYTIDYTAGTISYLLREPFRSLLSKSIAASIYSQTGTDLYELSVYSQKFEYVRNARSFQLKHMNVVAGSVSVRINGVTISPSLYSLSEASGTVEFVDANNPVVSDSTEIEIRYQYAQSNLSDRGFLAGLRGDYRVNEMLALGSTALYGRSNATDVVPEQGNEPTQNLVFEGDSTITIGEAKFGKLANAVTGGSAGSIPLSFKGYAEYAHSIYSVNTFGKMLVDDMEADTEEASISLSERDWILSSMPSGADQTDRADLFYKYYRSLSSLSVLRTLSFTPYSIAYETKAGPYNVCEGHITYSDSEMNSVRRSLVFDADFSAGSIASAVTRVNGGTETDLSALQYVEVWYRSTGGTGSADLSLDLGQINEDADGTGILKTEDKNLNGYLDRDPSAGTDEDAGYAFAPSGGHATRVGGGPGLNSMTSGDGTLTTEDLNLNGTLDIADRTISFPGTFAWKESDTAYSSLSIDCADTSWKKARIYLKRSTLTETELYRLRHVTALRLNLHSTGASKAVICIDSLRIVSSRWKDVAVNGVADEDITKMKVNLVDSINDAEYRANSFMSQERSEYTSLYGDRTDSDINDEKESALSLTYALSGGNGSATRHFSKTLDLRRYHTLSLWLNPRENTSGDVLRFYVCTSPDDYTRYDIPLNWTMGWRKVTLRLDSGSKGTYAAAGSAGVPDRGQITMMKAEIAGSSGRLWIDTILAAEPYTLTGDAYWCEGTVNVTRPLYVTDGGTAVARDLSVSVLRKYHSGNYNSPGRTDLGMSDDTSELRTGVELLPGWRNSFSASFRKANVNSFDPSYTDTDRGLTDRDSYAFTSEYRKNDPFSPLLVFSYNGENLNRKRDEYISSSRVTEKTEKSSHSPSLVYEQSLKDPLEGVLKIRTVLDNTFSRETVKREAADGSVLSGDDVVLHSQQAGQMNNLNCVLDYSLGKIFFSPQYRVFQNEIVSYSSTGIMSGSILEQVDGGFHLPFVSSANSRNVERVSEYAFDWGLRNVPVCGFSDRMAFQYDQNTFNDYTSAERSVYGGFKRDHSATSESERTVRIPFTFQNELFSFIRSVNFNWTRKMSFTETGVPYEGEGHGFYGENYGVERAFAATAPEILNLYRYSPFYFFSGRGTCANARDHLNSRMNSPLAVGGTAVSSYGNALKMVENLGLANSFVFKGISVNTGASVNQVTSRETVSSLPGQQMTVSANCDAGFDLMNLLSFGFFRPNNEKGPTHSARCTIGYTFARTMIFTANTLESSHQPSAGISFGWAKSQISFNAGLDFRLRQSHDFISGNAGARSAADDLYYEAMTHEKIREKTLGYTFRTRYETDVPSLYRFFLQFYELTNYPLFSLEYSLILNRYDYSYSVAPEPYDQHLLTAKLDFDLHKNVKGGITGQMALERWYNRETHGLYREVVSYDAAFSATIVF
jgi:hypothetical protein